MFGRGGVGHEGPSFAKVDRGARGRGLLQKREIQGRGKDKEVGAWSTEVELSAAPLRGAA